MDVERLEIELLFEALHQCYGHDFRNYAFDSARRRVLHRMHMEQIDSVGELQARVLHDREAADRLLRDLSINVTEMFRDPEFFRALRDDVLPGLRDEAHIKIWHAGCASGEEVYSMAILLEETGLYDRCQVYATDFNPDILQAARLGIFPLQSMRQNVFNYHAAGGERDFSDYYHALYDGAAMVARLKRNLVFAHHDLSCDESFGEMHMIICRNVLIYFDSVLKERVLRLFMASLVPGGVLCLGPRESLAPPDLAGRFQQIDAEQRIFRKRES